MSKNVVKSERNIRGLSPQSVVQLASELNVDVPALNPNAPMPLGFSEAWCSAGGELVKAVQEDKEGSQLKLAELLGVHVNRFFAGWNSSFRLVQGIAAGVIAVPALLSAVTLGFSWAEHGSASMVYGVIMGLMFGGLVGTIPVMTLSEVATHHENKLTNPIKLAFDSASYEQRVAQWAKERYGVVIPAGAWVEPTGRVSKDIAYLGVKDGENVYCFETDSGWIIGYRDGTELPVRVNEKELVKA